MNVNDTSATVTRKNSTINVIEFSGPKLPYLNRSKKSSKSKDNDKSKDKEKDKSKRKKKREEIKLNERT